MNIVTLNPNKLTMEDIDREQHRVKVLLFNSKDEVLLCKINGVYNFIGGHIEGNETPVETAQREIKEEAGISMRLGNFSAPFFKLQSFEKNYYNSSRNYFTTIEFLEGKTDMPIDLVDTMPHAASIHSLMRVSCIEFNWNSYKHLFVCNLVLTIITGLTGVLLVSLGVFT